MAKRILDIVLSCGLLVLLSPVIALTALAVLTNLGRPALFRQTRIGVRAKPFILLKFRTMRPLSTAASTATSDAERLTRFGGFLRSTSLDELPQLWNVLRGDMSLLIGPRPLLEDYLPYYTAEQMRRHDVRPGITGWAQVKGRNAITWDKKLALDVWYVDHRSMLLDCYILWLTLLHVVRRTDVSAAGHATMPRFDDEVRRTRGARS